MQKIYQQPNETRAEYMLRVAAAYIEDHFQEGIILYDEAECDGICVIEDCRSAIEESQLQRAL